MPPDLRLAALTLDVEHDYGSRTGRLGVLEDREGLARFRAFAADSGVPISAFVVTSLLESHPPLADLVRDLAAEVHSHTHTHFAGTLSMEEELTRSLERIRRFRGDGRIGYRAPWGRLDAAQVECAARAGYAFSSSVFPSFRPGVFNHLHLPLVPFRHGNGLLELPFAAVRGIRLVISASYIKLLGWPLYRLLLQGFGPPPIVVIDSHLHDFLATDSFDRLPPGPRFAWGIRRHRGIECTDRLVRYLRALGYEFVTLSNIARRFERTGNPP